ncbi:hypothetical protein [Corallococcus carmarthensis]|uniref:Uncharacterized protein n=1 Tax=Corallococcus carmarthensis TaxID=2316728 RepID=A0A3A8JIT0_9BACT|nr:hypothetical protein [Corallococcus carmarthensis]NOK21642.1 hypothetical protein [Corallococcus carmarthensis]RKG95657.1 hypothetical protein D7X32_38405 [Corallococcus carmarthensis]
MPAEVLVMCSACGRPQSAARRRCAFCNAELPEAPLPAVSPAAPTPTPRVSPLALDLGNRRALAVNDEQLSFQGRPGGGPALDVPWSRVKRLEWRTRPYFEALGLLAFTALGFWAPAQAVRFMAFAAGVIGLLLAVLYRHHGLTVELEDGTRMQWPLGMAIRGSAREARLTAARAVLVDAGRARGIPLGGSGA